MLSKSLDSLVSALWGVGKRFRHRCNYAERGVPDGYSVCFKLFHCKIEWFNSLEAVKHSKVDSMDYIAQFRVMNTHQ